MANIRYEFPAIRKIAWWKVAIVNAIFFHVLGFESCLPGELVLAHPIHILRCNPVARASDAKPLQSRTKLIKFPDLLLGKLPYVPPLIRDFDQKPIRFEPVHRFTNRRCTYVQLSSDDVRT